MAATQGIKVTEVHINAGAWVEGRERLPTHMLCTGTCHVHRGVSADKCFMAVLSKHSFPGDHNNVLPPKLVLLLYSLSLQMTAPSNQFPKSGSSSNSPLTHLCHPNVKRVLSYLHKVKSTLDQSCENRKVGNTVWRTSILKRSWVRENIRVTHWAREIFRFEASVRLCGRDHVTLDFTIWFQSY